jgi:predicted kinase
MPKFLMLSGPPGAGKSTYLKKVAPAMPGAVLISPDSFIEDWVRETGADYEEVFRSRWAEAEKASASLFDRAIHEGRDIIWDQTNLTRKVRRSRLCQLPDGYDATAVGFLVPIKILRQRAEARRIATGKSIPRKTLKSMFFSYDPPGPEEGFNRVFHVRGKSQKVTRIL